MPDGFESQKRIINIAVASIFSVAILVPSTALAVEGGYSNYIPGTYGDFGVAIEPATKLTVRNDTYYYQADDEQSIRSGQLDVGAELTFTVNMTTLLFKPDVELFGAQYAFGALFPIVNYEIESSLQSTGRIFNASVKDESGVSGMGDVVLVPWVLFWNNEHLHTTFAQYIIAPTADYSVKDPINAGLNYWSFDTNIAVTHLNPETGREFSINVGHIYNTENSDTDYHSGREVHIDYSFNQFLSDTFALGIQGFYWRQVSGDSGDGALLGSFKGKAAGIGLALLWTTQIGNNSTSFIVKWIHEYDTERRIEGDHIMVSFALGF